MDREQEILWLIGRIQDFIERLIDTNIEQNKRLLKLEKKGESQKAR